MVSIESRPVLVTGGAGFIGANLCRHLIEAGAPRVIVLDDFATGDPGNLAGLPVELVEGSILDADLTAAVTPPGGVVVHLAALGSVPRSVADPARSHEVNATGTLRVLEAARSVGASQVILASSSSVYGDNPAPAKHEGLPTSPRSPYGASKLAAEAYTLAYQRTYGLPALAFRFFNVFGPLQPAGHAYAAVIPSFVDSALAGRPVVVHGDGGQSRDFTFVDTVCATIVDAVHRGVSADGPINLAFGTQVSLLEVIGLLEEQLGVTLEREHRGGRPGDIRRSRADPTRLRQLFPGIQPVGLAEGIRVTVAWFTGRSAWAGPANDPDGQEG